VGCSACEQSRSPAQKLAQLSGAAYAFEYSMSYAMTKNAST